MSSTKKSPNNSTKGTFRSPHSSRESQQEPIKLQIIPLQDERRYVLYWRIMLSCFFFLAVSTFTDFGLTKLYRGHYSRNLTDPSIERYYQRIVRKHILSTPPVSAQSEDQFSNFMSKIVYRFGLQSIFNYRQVPIATTADNWELTSQLIDSNYATFEAYLSNAKRRHDIFNAIVYEPKHESIVHLPRMTIEVAGLAVAGVVEDLVEGISKYSRNISYLVRLDRKEIIPLQTVSKVMDGPVRRDVFHTMINLYYMHCDSINLLYITLHYILVCLECGSIWAS